MAVTYKTPSQVGDEYLQYLKALKPTVNINQKDSDWYIRSRSNGGIVSGLYADQQKVANDIFPNTARHDAIANHLSTWGLVPFKSAQPANGTVSVTGNIGTTISIGLQMSYDPNGNTYNSTSGFIMSGTTAVVPVTSTASGQAQNLLPGAQLTVNLPGLQSTAVVLTMGDGSDPESDTSAAQRVVTRIQEPISGGTQTDYEQWALASDPSVTSAKVRRFPFGPGTVAVYLTAGTTNIDEAINQGQPIVRQPTQVTIDAAAAYIDALNPIDDCLYVFGIQEIPVDVTVRRTLSPGLSGGTILSGESLTIDQLTTREVTRALYKVPTGGRVINGLGYVVASEVEEALDSALSAQPYSQGTIAQVLIDRQVNDLSATGTNLLLAPNQAVVPGVINIVDL